MLSRQQLKVIEGAKSVAVLDVLQAIEAHYAYEGIPKDLLDVLEPLAQKYEVRSYSMPIILLPLRPKYVDLILEGKKTLELRLSFPDYVDKFRVLIYETKNDFGSGQVVGEFICDGYEAIPWVEEESNLPFVNESEDYYYITGEQLTMLCLEYEEVKNYGRTRALYAWNVTQVTTYDKPMPLSHYARPENFEPLTRPPQSYFEVVELYEG